MKKYFLLLLLFLLPAFTYSQFSPSVNIYEPNQFSKYIGQGILKDVEVEVTPLGLTTQYDFTFKMSIYDENTLDPNAQYEIVYIFGLPDNSYIKDSWLWVDDTLVIASIKDKWSANSIYEGIVSRRKDPSILQKVQGKINEYELRVFPYLKEKPRKVKISFCVYNEYTNGMFESKFPILNMLNLRYGESFKDYNLKINLNEKIEFQYLTHFDMGIVYPQKFTLIDKSLNLNTRLNLNYNNSYATFTFKPKMENGFFYNINEHEFTKDKYYEMLLDVGSLQTQFISNKYIFIIDFNKDKTNFNFKTNISYLSLIDEISTFIRNNLSLSDKFNFINSSTKELSILSDTWLDVNEENFDKVDTWMNNISPNYGFHIEKALDSAAQFFINTQSSGTVITYSSSDHLGASSNNSITYLANKFIQSKSTINCISFANLNYATYYIGGKNYLANEYFFKNLTGFTRGNYSIAGTLNDITNQSKNILNNMLFSFQEGELTLSSQSALAYQKRDLTNIINGNISNPIIVETGKLFGELPVQFKFSGIYGNNIITSNSKIANEFDSIGRFTPVFQLWKANEIKRLEAIDNNSKDHIWSIVDNSLESRVLSKYSAFLALEPWMTNYYNPYEDDEVNTSIGEIELNDAINIEIYPNPVESKSLIKIKTDLEFLTNQMEVVLLDYTGKIVKKLGLQNMNIEFIFEPIDDDGNKIATGRYLLVLKSKYGTLTKNLIIK